MRNRLLLIPIACTVFVSSCGLGDGLEIVRANRLFRSGYAHEAVALYLGAGAGIDAVASYNIANAFISLSEKQAAMTMFQSAISVGDTPVAARSWFNIGVSEFNAAGYPEAANAFRKALEAYIEDPAALSRRAARRDAAFRLECSRAYELALDMASRKQETGAVERSAYGTGSSSDDSQPFSLSRSGERTLYAPGEATLGGGVDH